MLQILIFYCEAEFIHTISAGGNELTDCFGPNAVKAPCNLLVLVTIYCIISENGILISKQNCGRASIGSSDL